MSVPCARIKPFCFCYCFFRGVCAIVLFSAPPAPLPWSAAMCCQVVKGATAQAMMNRAAALVKWEGIMSDKTRRQVRWGEVARCSI